MTWWLAILLGIVQGLTEFLPVSSSGHLSIIQHFFGVQGVADEYILFDVLLHVGTLFAVIAAFWSDIREMALEFCRFFRDLFTGKAKMKIPPARRTILLVLVATLPLALVFFFKDLVREMFERPLLVGFALIATAALLFLADSLPKGKKDERSATLWDVLFVGFMQVLATIPGLSRSGTTISAGLFRRFDRKFAVRFAFLMSIPAVVGAAVLEVGDAVQEGIPEGVLPMYLVGMLLAGLTGYLAISLVRRLADKGRFGAFAIYCLVIGGLTVVASLFLG